MKWLYFISIFFSFAVYSQEIEIDPALLEVFEVVELSENTELPILNKQEKAPKCSGEKKETETIMSEEVDFAFEFSVMKVTGIDTTPEKKYLEHNQMGFNEKWMKLIQTNNRSEREAVAADICSDMSQEQAIAFAGYMGAKKGAVYDYDRATGGTQEAQSALVTIDEYYEVHRNVAGIGDGSRKKIGVCGDAARAIAEFLSMCGFSCDDIDISSYRTQGSGGHQMVTARGKNGEYFAANWSEASVETNMNPLQASTPTPTNVNGAAFVENFDCNGRSKGKVTTPLGSLILMAHDAKFNQNHALNYSEVKILATKLGATEASLKYFEGNDPSSGANLSGFGAQISKTFGTDESLMMLQTKGSLIFGRAKSDITYSGYYDQRLLTQNIISPRIEALLGFNLNPKDRIRFKPFIEGDVTQVVFFNKDKQTNFLGQTTLEEETNGDFNAHLGTGLNIAGQSKNEKVSFSSTVGMRTQLLRNVSQKSQMQTVEGDIKQRRYLLYPNQIYGEGQITLNPKGNSSTLKVDYNNFYLIKQNQFQMTSEQALKNTKLSANYLVLKNPSTPRVHSFGGGITQKIPFKKSDNSLLLGAGAQYYVLEGIPNQGTFNLKAVYRFGK